MSAQTDNVLISVVMLSATVPLTVIKITPKQTLAIFYEGVAVLNVRLINIAPVNQYNQPVLWQVEETSQMP